MASTLSHSNSPAILPSSFFSSTLWASSRASIQPGEVGGSAAPVAAALSLRCCCLEGRNGVPFLLDRDGSVTATSSFYRVGFSQSLGFGRQQHGWRKSGSSCSDGEGRHQTKRITATQNRRTFFGKDEEGESSEAERISLPIIGKLPLTQKELSMITPMKVVVWVTLCTLAYCIWDAVSSRTIFNPKFWMYSTWMLVKWPWPAAISVGIATLVTAFRSSKRQPKEWEQVLLLLGSLTWLILVPAGVFNGFVDGWPLTLFTVYVGFFLISAVVRYRLYGDLQTKEKDKQWETTPSRLWQIGFVASVVLGHWLAAYEAPFLLYTWNLEWRSVVAIVTLAVAVVTHYTATYFLGKYFDRLVRPVAVVVFGPYRVVRHPIYASYILLFAGYCLALRSYKSLLFLFTACVVYYEQRTKLEEDMLVETFGDLYERYRERVANNFCRSQFQHWRTPSPVTHQDQAWTTSSNDNKSWMIVRPAIPPV